MFFLSSVVYNCANVVNFYWNYSDNTCYFNFRFCFLWSTPINAWFHILWAFVDEDPGGYSIEMYIVFWLSLEWVNFSLSCLCFTGASKIGYCYKLSRSRFSSLFWSLVTGINLFTFSVYLSYLSFTLPAKHICSIY